jgi:hypothetical protein
MAGRDIVRLMNEARSSLVGATDPTLQLALFGVMDDFFRGTNAWQEDIDVQVAGGAPAGTIYELVPTGASLINQLMWVFVAPKSAQELRGVPVNAAMSVPGELTIYTQPSSDMVYRATVALTVADPLTREGNVIFPAWVLQKYRAVILDGLLGRMMAQPNKPFSNLQLSVYHSRKFNSGIASARVEVQRNNRYRAQAWRFPGFAGGSQKGGHGWAGPQ